MVDGDLARAVARAQSAGPLPVLESWTVPGHPLVAPIPYVPGLAEYADMVREEILRRSERSFVVAVDLPHGLEREVLNAARKLPAPSLVLDQLHRGIPVLPSSAPIEAVRSFFDFGHDIRFIDASLPVSGAMNEYIHFVRSCQQFGLDRVLSDLPGFGVNPEELFRGWVESGAGSRPGLRFPHCPEACLQPEEGEFDEATASPYLRTRLACMAAKVRELEQIGIEILLVCDVRLLPGILYYLDHGTGPVDDGFVVPATTIPLLEADVVRVAQEVPFYAYLYDVFRDLGVDRRSWLEHLVREAYGDGEPAGRLADLVSYAERIALFHGDTAPGLLEMVLSALTVCDDDFAVQLLDRAISYPPAEDHRQSSVPSRVLQLFVEFDTPRRLDPRLTIYDFNFVPVLGLGVTIRRAGEILRDHREATERRRGGRRSGSFYHRWMRTPESIAAEEEFTRYLLARFPPPLSETDYSVVEYQSSLEAGIDIRESLRKSHLGQVFVRVPEPGGSQAYVFDYRGFRSRESGGGTLRASGLSAFFFDRSYDWAGLGATNGMHYDTAMLVMFTELPVPVTGIFSRLESGDPLGSAVSLALEHCDRAMVFTDQPEDLGRARFQDGRLVRHPLKAISAPVFEKMAAFDIAYYRIEDTRGD